MVLVLLLLALLVNLLYPGEVFLASRYLWLLVAPLALAASLAAASDRLGLRAVVSILAVTFLPSMFLLASLPKSINPARSEEVFWLFFSFSCAFAAVRLAAPCRRWVEILLLALCAAASLLCILAIYQRLAGLHHLQDTVSRAAGLDESFRTVLLTRLRSGRVFANFALPNSLAGFLATVFPFQLLFLFFACRNDAGSIVGKTGRMKPLVAALGLAQVLLSVIVLCLTQSFGGWVCVLTSCFAAGAYLLTHKRVALRSLLMPALLVLLAGLSWVIWITARRGFGLWNLNASDNPIALRWINFKTALQIFSDFPLTGVGLGNYGTINPVYQSNPLHVTQYAHNTILQLLSESGFVFFLLLLASGMMLFRRRRTIHSRPAREPDSLTWHNTAFVASLSAWSVHNLLDISLYLPSLGSLGVMILALWTALRIPPVLLAGNGARLHKASLWMSGAAAGVVLVIATLLILRLYIGQLRLETTRNLIEDGQIRQAQGELEQSIRVSGKDARAYAVLAKISLLEGAAEGGLSREEMQAASSLYQKAIALSPYEAQLHSDYSKILMALGQRESAMAARRRAHELFPSEKKYEINPADAVVPGRP